MRTEIVALALLAPALLACEPEEPVPFAPGRDGSIDQPDTGPRFTFGDAGSDAGPSPDAGPLPDGGSSPDDAGPTPDGGEGPSTPIVDGTLGETEWSGALERTADVPSGPGFAGDRLTRLLAIRTDTRLYVAIEGTLAAGHAIVMYVDADFEEPNGVLLSSGEDLADRVGALDQSLSAPLRSTVVRPEYAWGTTMMPIALSSSDDLGGWRDIATNPTNFAAIGGITPTRCSATVCETSIAIGLSGIANARRIALFVRLTDTFGNLSNQTLPLELDMPELPSDPLLIEPPGGA